MNHIVGLGLRTTWDKDSPNLYQHRDFDEHNGDVVEDRRYPVPHQVFAKCEHRHVPAVDDWRELVDLEAARNVDDGSDLQIVNSVKQTCLNTNIPKRAVLSLYFISILSCTWNLVMPLQSSRYSFPIMHRLTRNRNQQNRVTVASESASVVYASAASFGGCSKFDV